MQDTGTVDTQINLVDTVVQYLEHHSPVDPTRLRAGSRGSSELKTFLRLRWVPNRRTRRTRAKVPGVT